MCRHGFMSSFDESALVRQFTLLDPVPNTPPLTIPFQHPILQQSLEMLFQRISAGSGQESHFLDRDATVFAGVFHDASGQVRQGVLQQAFPFHLGGQTLHLRVQGAQEEGQPWLPVRRIRVQGGLGLAQGQVVAFLGGKGSGRPLANLSEPVPPPPLEAQFLAYPSWTAFSMPANSSSVRNPKCDSFFFAERRPLFCRQSWMKRSMRRSGMSTICCMACLVLS